MKSKIVLIAGDAIVILIAVMLGLSFHQREVAARLQYTLFPFLGAWLLAAWALGLYAVAAWRSLWHVPVAAVLAAPLGAVVRAAWLGSTAIPIFAAVMAGVLAVGMLIWRALFLFFIVRGTKR